MMTASLAGLAFLLAMTVIVVAHWRIGARNHLRRLRRLEVTLHVNGIRGKSTVTRLLAGVMREGGYTTIAKTTGSAARVIEPDGTEFPIRRWGAPSIHEQVDVVRQHVSEHVNALVIECMAVRPLYQRYSQDFLVRSNITIITNVRLDHQEEMGETLEEIADSLSETIPRGGLLITAEEQPHLRERLARNAAARGSRVIFADPAAVRPQEMRGFDYLQFRSNVAIGFALADHLAIPRERALAGMWKAVPDVGAIRLRTYEIKGKQITWVPMFAANDRESVVQQLVQLTPMLPPDATLLALLNNRVDRGRRALLFTDMVPDEIGPMVDEVVLLGAYERLLEPRIVAAGYPAGHVHILGDSVRPDLDALLDALVRLIPGEAGVLIGMVNIHTDQAELLIEHFAGLDGADRVDELSMSRDPRRLSDGQARLRQARHVVALHAGWNHSTPLAHRRRRGARHAAPRFSRFHA